MGLTWNLVRIGIYRQHNTLFIGKLGTDKDTNKVVWKSRSDDRTEEIITTVAEKMRKDIDRQNNPDKPYVGYNVPGVGKLVMIKDGFDFNVIPSPRKRKSK